MEQQSWDYSNARIHGRNIFLYRDTSHISEVIQERLYSELCENLKQKLFKVVFAEGRASNFSPLEFKGIFSEAQLKEEALNHTGRPLVATERLAYGSFSKSITEDISIVGIEREGLHEKHRESLRQLVYFRDICNSRALTFEEFSRNLCLIKREGSLSKRRGLWAAQKAINYMSSNGLQTAALVMGDAHSKEITAHLKRNGFGYASFFPGEAVTDIRGSANYANKL